MKMFNNLASATILAAVLGQTLGGVLPGYGNQPPAQQVTQLYGPPPPPSSPETAYASKAEPQEKENTQEDYALTYQSSPDINEDNWDRSRAFSFGYQAKETSRHEQSDENGNVIGSYTLVGADGVPFEVFYRAGSETGFVVENLDEVRARTTPKEYGAESASSGAYSPIAQPQQNTKSTQQHQGGFQFSQNQQSASHHQGVVQYAQPQQTSFNSMTQKQQANSIFFQNNVNKQDEDESYKPYSFEYNGEAGSRKEQADQSGNVKGEYTINGANGKPITVQYKAGPETGFEIENQEELDKALEESSQAVQKTQLKNKNSNQKNQYSQYNQQPQQVENNQHSQQQGFNRYNQQQNNFQAQGSNQHFAANQYAQQQPQQNTRYAQPQEQKNNQDEEESYKPYAFEYQGDSGAHKEQADESGNVKGEYSYIGADGKTIKVQYKAGPETGFVIENQEELDKALEESNQAIQKNQYNQQSQKNQHQQAPQQQKQPNPYQTQQQKQPNPYQAQQQKQPNPYQAQQQKQPNQYQTQQSEKSYAHQQQNNANAYSQPQEQDQQQKNEDGSYKPYAFEFALEDGGRKEEADETGNVKGEYTYQTADGKTIKVQYTASPETGFVIENQEELEAALEEDNNNAQAQQFSPNAYSQAQSERYGANQAPTPEQIQFQEAYALGQQQRKKFNQGQQAETNYPQQYAQAPQGNNNPYAQQQKTDQQQQDEEAQYNPYSFNYRGDDSSRQEQAGEDGKVRGQYSYINNEGNTILVQYSASPETGFVIENEEELAASLEKATREGAQASAAKKTEEHRQEAQKKQEEQPNLNAFNPYAYQTGPLTPVVTQQTQFHGKPLKKQQQAPQAHGYSQNAYAPTLPVASLPEQNAPIRKKIIIRKRRPVAKSNQGTQGSFNNFPQVNQAASYASPQQSHNQQQKEEPEYKDYDYSDSPQTPIAFAYSAKDHSQSEETNDQGERFGSYRYVTPEGTEVEVKYRAGRNGFEILN